jgi:hypothetical protein
MAITTTDPVSGSVISSSAWGHSVFTDLTNLDRRGFVSDTLNNSTAATSTGTETVVQSITFTAVLGLRYRALWSAEFESTVAADLCTMRLRWKNTAIADTTGTAFRTNNKEAGQASKPDMFILHGTFNTQVAGNLTVVATLQRFSGTGTCKIDGGAIQEQYMYVEIVK